MHSIKNFAFQIKIKIEHREQEINRKLYLGSHLKKVLDE